MSYTQKTLDNIQHCICQIRNKFNDNLIEDKDKLIFLMNNQSSIKHIDLILDDIINKNDYEEDFINKAKHLKRQFTDIKENDIKNLLSLKKNYIDAEYTEIPSEIIPNEEDMYILIYKDRVLSEQLTEDKLQNNIQALLKNEQVNPNEISIIKGGKILDVKVNYNVEYVEHTL